jgi:hypothetical protein
MEKIKSIKQFIISLLPLLIIANFFVIVLYYLIGYFEQKNISETLIYIEPIFLGVNFALIIGSFVLNLKDLRKLLKPINKKVWLSVIAIFLLAFYIRMFVAPQTHRVFFDEDIYLDIGKEILTERKACLCNYGDYKGCYECILMKWPNGFPFTVAVAFSIFGISEPVGYALNIFLGSLSAVLIFLIGYLISKEVKIGLFAALMFALIPQHIVWSSSTASEPMFVFYALLAVFAFLLSFEFNTWWSNLFAISSLAFAMQVKTESGALLALFGLLMLLLDKKLRIKIGTMKFLVPWIIFLVLVTPYIIHTYHSSKTDPWGSSGKMFGFEFFKENAPTNTWFWTFGYETIEHPLLFTIFALIGFIFTFKKEKGIIFFLGIWFMIFFMVYAFFYAGSVRYGTDVRYSLIGYPPLVLLAGYGVFFLHKNLSKKIKSDLLISSIFVLIIFILGFSFYYKSVSTMPNDITEANQARIYHDFVVDYAKNLDKNCYILSHVSSIYLVLGKGSLQTWNGQNEQVMRELFSKTDCVIFDDGFWCNLEPYKSSVCKNIFDKFKITPLDSVTAKEGKPTYTLYKIENPYK